MLDDEEPTLVQTIFASDQTLRTAPQSWAPLPIAVRSGLRIETFIIHEFLVRAREDYRDADFTKRPDELETVRSGFRWLEQHSKLEVAVSPYGNMLARPTPEWKEELVFLKSLRQQELLNNLSWFGRWWYKIWRPNIK